MALMAYLWLKGQKQGPITGSITQKGREGTIAVIAVSHSIVSPRDPNSGLPTGKRLHKPFSFRKELDMSTPLILNSLAQNENLTQVKFEFFATDGTAEKNVYTVEMVNASIASYDVHQGDVRDVDLAKRPVWEDVTLTYQKITWTWVKGGITASDDWETPVA